MRVTRWGEYGILCCLYLAQRAQGAGEEDAPVGASEIAEKQRIPLQYAQQILHRLRKGEVIRSVRGPKGGFLLVKDPSEINLREILLAAEGKTFELICEADPIFEGECCASSDCGLRSVWQSLQDSINSLLEGHTLKSLLTAHPSPSNGAGTSFKGTSRGIGTDSKEMLVPAPQRREA